MREGELVPVRKDDGDDVPEPVLEDESDDVPEPVLEDELVPVSELLPVTVAEPEGELVTVADRVPDCELLCEHVVEADEVPVEAGVSDELGLPEEDVLERLVPVNDDEPV